jgi:hypothetical protein
VARSPDCQIASIPPGLLSFLPVSGLQSPAVPSWSKTSKPRRRSTSHRGGRLSPAVSSLLGAKRGKGASAIGLQLVYANSFSCLALHRHALCQTGTVSGDLYRYPGTSNTASSHSLESFDAKAENIMPPEWLDYENAAARLFCRGQTPRCGRPVLHAWSGQRSNGCCGQHGRCKFGSVMRPEFESQTVQKIENATAVDKDGCRCRCRCSCSWCKVGGRVALYNHGGVGFGTQRPRGGQRGGRYSTS